MKVALYMAVTVNGMVAGEGDDTSWVSEEEWKSFIGIARRNGNMIIGRRTCEIMIEEGSMAEMPNDLIVVVVTSHENFRTSQDLPQKFFLVRSPSEALKLLEKKGFKKAIITGGGKLNASFIREGLIDEIYLDIEPKVLGKGIGLFAKGDFEADLELLGVKKLNKRTVQLHYKVRM